MEIKNFRTDENFNGLGFALCVCDVILSAQKIEDVAEYPDHLLGKIGESNLDSHEDRLTSAEIEEVKELMREKLQNCSKLNYIIRTIEDRSMNAYPRSAEIKEILSDDQGVRIYDWDQVYETEAEARVEWKRQQCDNVDVFHDTSSALIRWYELVAETPEGEFVECLERSQAPEFDLFQLYAEGKILCASSSSSDVIAHLNFLEISDDNEIVYKILMNGEEIIESTSYYDLIDLRNF